MTGRMPSMPISPPVSPGSCDTEATFSANAYQPERARDHYRYSRSDAKTLAHSSPLSALHSRGSRREQEDVPRTDQDWRSKTGASGSILYQHAEPQDQGQSAFPYPKVITEVQLAPRRSLAQGAPYEQLTPESSTMRQGDDDLIGNAGDEGGGGGEEEEEEEEEDVDEPAMTSAERRALKRKLKRFRLTHSQTRFLMNEFAKQAHPDGAHRERLSQEIPGLSPRQVQVWFQNRRAKLKRLTAEDQERMMKSRTLPPDFDMTQVLNSSYVPQNVGLAMASPASGSYASYPGSSTLRPMPAGVSDFNPYTQRYTSQAQAVPAVETVSYNHDSRQKATQSGLTPLSVSQAMYDSPIHCPQQTASAGHRPRVAEAQGASFSTTKDIQRQGCETVRSALLQDMSPWIEPSLPLSQQDQAASYSFTSQYAMPCPEQQRIVKGSRPTDATFIYTHSRPLDIGQIDASPSLAHSVKPALDIAQYRPASYDPGLVYPQQYAPPTYSLSQAPSHTRGTMDMSWHTGTYNSSYD